MYNNRHINHLGYSPMEILFGVIPNELGEKELEFPTDDREAVVTMLDREEFWELSQTEDWATAIINFMGWREQRRDLIVVSDKEEKEEVKRRFDRTIKNHTFKIGDLVMRHRTRNTAGHQKKKLESPWEGPAVIIRTTDEHGITFQLKQPGKAKEVRGFFHGDNLRPFALRTGYLIPSVESRLPHYIHIRKHLLGHRSPNNINHSNLITTMPTATSKYSGKHKANKTDIVMRARARLKKKRQTDREQFPDSNLVPLAGDPEQEQIRSDQPSRTVSF